MPTAEKVEQIALLKGKFEDAEAVFFSEYRGLTVAQITDIRAKVREVGGEMKVAKNTLVRIALKEAGFPAPQELTVGPNVYIIAYKDAPAVAKALRDFAGDKANKAFVMKGGVMGEDILSLDNVKALADLPSRDQLIAQVVSTIAAPIRGLVTVLSGPARGLATCLSQIKDQKEKAA